MSNLMTFNIHSGAREQVFDALIWLHSMLEILVFCGCSFEHHALFPVSRLLCGFVFTFRFIVISIIFFCLRVKNLLSFSTISDHRIHLLPCLQPAGAGGPATGK